VLNKFTNPAVVAKTTCPETRALHNVFNKNASREVYLNYSYDVQ